MTTIATDGRTLAADSLCTGGGQVLAHHAKVHRLPDDRVFAACGDVEDCIKFARWMRGETDPPELEDSFSALGAEASAASMFPNHNLSRDRIRDLYGEAPSGRPQKTKDA